MTQDFSAICHAALSGTVRDWADAPDPGEDYNCRCWAEPVKDPYSKCADLQHQLLVAAGRWDGLQKSLSEAFDSYNSSLEDWKKAQDELYKIAAQAGLAVGVPEKAAWDVGTALVMGVLQIPNIQNIENKVDQAREKFQGVQNIIAYLQRDIQEVSHEIESIKAQMDFLGCK